MHARITGKQARELLDGTTPGPWELLTQDGDPDGIVEAIGPMGAEFPVGTSFYDGPILTGPTEDHRLLATAPALAETVAWLYGREPDTYHPDNGTWWDTHEYFISQGVLGVTIFDGSGESRTLDTEQAVDLARALLNAAERMGNTE